LNIFNPYKAGPEPFWFRAGQSARFASLTAGLGGCLYPDY